ncbi:protein of unknown function [Nitratireductor aquimarinus]
MKDWRDSETIRAEVNSQRQFLAAKARSYIARTGFTKAKRLLLLTSTNVGLEPKSTRARQLWRAGGAPVGTC